MSHGFFSKDVIIVNELGLHARAAAKIVGIAQNANSSVWIIKDNEKIDAKSILDILTLACRKGSRIAIIIETSQDRDILNQLVALIENGFGE